MKKRGLFAIFFGMAVLSFGLFNSCDIDIGLGSAVDVEPPTLYIENPPASKIIRDAFPISGTFSDDGSISAITVELTNTETQVKYPKIDGTWGKENTWSATVDPIKLKIPDGKYEATITIRDNGGHHSVSTRSFIIDNTAPVVVLSRPTSDAAESDLNKIESYGQYLTLEGQAADDNDIEKIVIKFYSKDNPDKDPIVKEITSIPPTISLDVAKFLDENDPTYTKLYGTDKMPVKNIITVQFLPLMAQNAILPKVMKKQMMITETKKAHIFSGQTGKNSRANIQKQLAALQKSNFLNCIL